MANFHTGNQIATCFALQQCWKQSVAYLQLADFCQLQIQMILTMIAGQNKQKKAWKKAKEDAEIGLRVDLKDNMNISECFPPAIAKPPPAAFGKPQLMLPTSIFFFSCYLCLQPSRHGNRAEIGLLLRGSRMLLGPNHQVNNLFCLAGVGSSLRHQHDA